MEEARRCLEALVPCELSWPTNLRAREEGGTGVENDSVFGQEDWGVLLELVLVTTGVRRCLWEGERVDWLSPSFLCGVFFPVTQ